MPVSGSRFAAALACALVISGPLLASSTVSSSAADPIAHVAIVVPITVPERSTGLISSASLENLTAPSGLLNRELDQVIGKPVVLAIDPAIIVSIRVLGASAPPSAVTWLQRLNAAANETFPLTWADSDVTAELQAGSKTVLDAQSFDFAIDPAQINEATLELEGSPADPTASTDPTDYTARMLAFNYSLDNVAWPAANSLTDADLAPLAESGFTSTILSSENVRMPDRSHGVATVDGHQVFVSDDVLNGLFNSAVAARSTAEWTPSKNSLLDGIRSVVAGASGNSVSVVLTLDRDLSASDTDLGATIDAISALPVATTTNLTDVARQPAVTAAIDSKPQAEHRVKLVAELLAAERQDAKYSLIAKDPSRVAAPRRLDLLAILSNSWSVNPEGWELGRVSYLDASATLHDSVQIVPGGAITLLADRAALPVTVSNSLDQSVTVYVQVRPLSPLIAVENPRVEMTIEPHSQRKGQIPVQSLSNGSVKLQVSLADARDVQIGKTVLLRTTVRAGWETPVTVAVGVVVVLIFLIGIYRNVSKRRRARAVAE